MNNWKLEYYVTPDQYVCFDEKQKLLRDINLTGWKMVHVGPADKNAYNWKSGFFVEDTEFMSKLLWDIKTEDEEIVVRICESWRKNIFREKMFSEQIEIEEEILECLGGKGAFIYQVGDEINKYVYINPGETLEFFFREECLEKMIEQISKIAIETEYFKYELGE